MQKNLKSDFFGKYFFTALYINILHEHNIIYNPEMILVPVLMMFMPWNSVHIYWNPG